MATVQMSANAERELVGKAYALFHPLSRDKAKNIFDQVLKQMDENDNQQKRDKEDEESDWHPCNVS